MFDEQDATLVVKRLGEMDNAAIQAVTSERNGLFTYLDDETKKKITMPPPPFLDNGDVSIIRATEQDIRGTVPNSVIPSLAPSTPEQQPIVAGKPKAQPNTAVDSGSAPAVPTNTVNCAAASAKDGTAAILSFPRDTPSKTAPPLAPPANSQSGNSTQSTTNLAPNETKTGAAASAPFTAELPADAATAANASPKAPAPDNHTNEAPRTPPRTVGTSTTSLDKAGNEPPEHKAAVESPAAKEFKDIEPQHAAPSPPGHPPDAKSPLPMLIDPPSVSKTNNEARGPAKSQLKQRKAPLLHCRKNLEGQWSNRTVGPPADTPPCSKNT